MVFELFFGFLFLVKQGGADMVPANNGQFPFAVTIWNDNPLCGGVIVDKQFVLTGPCPHLRFFQKKLRVGWGSVHGKDQKFTKVDNMYYLPGQPNLLRLEEPLVLNERVQPIALPKADPEPGQEGTVLVWNDVTFYNGSLDLMYIPTKVVSLGDKIIVVQESTPQNCLEDYGSALITTDSSGTQVVSGSFYSTPCTLGNQVFIGIARLSDYIKRIIEDNHI